MAKTKAERAAEFAGMLAAGIMDAQVKGDPRAATKQVVIGALRRHYGSDGTTVVKDLVRHISRTYLTVPFAARLIMHDVVEEAVLEWLPERSVMRAVTMGAFPLLTATIESLLARPTVTEDEIVNGLLPTFTTQFNTVTNTTGGHVADHPPAPGPVAAPPVPSYIEARGKLNDRVGTVIDRLLSIAELGSRKGNDPNPEVEGVAAMLRTAIVEEVTAAATDSVNKLISPWGEADITRLASADNPTFLGDRRVVSLIGTFVASYHRRHPGPMSAETEDAIDAFLDGYGVPKALQGPLRNVLKLENVESAADRVEDAVWPAVLHTFRLGFSLPVGGAALILITVSVLTLALQAVFLNEYDVALKTLSGFEIARRAVGFLLNAVYQVTVPTLYIVIAIVVGFPFLGIRRHPNGGWTMFRPTKPAPLPWHLDRRTNESEEAWKARVDRAKTGINQDVIADEEERFAAENEEFEEMDDDWRKAFRHSLVLRAGAIVATIVVGTILVVVAGIVVSIPTYQYLTIIQFVVIGVIGFHIVWLGDDLANAVRKATAKKDEHPAGDKHDKTIKRLRKISGTMTIIIGAAAFTYSVAILLAPWTWALVTLLPTYLLLGLAVFLVSRILFGDSEDAPHDVQHDSANQRRFVHKVVAGIFGFAGATLFVTSMLLSVAVHGYGWYQDCKGYEDTYECAFASDDGYSQYVDNRDRWEALRDRSAKALAKRHKPSGDSCVLATKDVNAINVQYRTSVLSSAADGLDVDVCSMLSSDGGLRTRFPKWSKTCAAQRVACKKG